jgi:hypothetical protein
MDSLQIPIRAFPSERRTTWVRRYYNSTWVLTRGVLPLSPGTHMDACMIAQRTIAREPYRIALTPQRGQY